MTHAVFSKTFANPSNARRAARAAGVEFSGVEQHGEHWAVVPVPTVTKLTVRHKEFAVYEPSRVERPVAFVHEYLDGHPDLSRKEALHALVAAGVNYATARTQYQRWFAGH